MDDVSLNVEQGEVLGIVGESGSGKSLAMLALMGLVPFPGEVSAGRLAFDGHDMLSLSEAARRSLTGKAMAMIFQEPATSLNPCFTVGFQIAETLRLHEKMDRQQAHATLHRTAGAGRHPGAGKPAVAPIRISSPAA